MVFNPEELLQSNLTKDGAQVINSHWGNNETRFRQINTNLGSHQTKFWNLGAWSSSQWEVGWPSFSFAMSTTEPKFLLVMVPAPFSFFCFFLFGLPPSSRSSFGSFGGSIKKTKGFSCETLSEDSTWCVTASLTLTVCDEGGWGHGSPTLDYICNKSGICLVMLERIGLINFGGPPPPLHLPTLGWWRISRSVSPRKANCPGDSATLSSPKS